MEPHDNKENLNDLEMAKKRDHKIVITDEAIKKVPRIQYKNIPESEYDTIQELAKTVLQISKDENNSNEVAITYIVKGNGYNYEKAVTLFNEAIVLNNEAGDLKSLQKAADHFLNNCYLAGIDYDNR